MVVGVAQLQGAILVRVVDRMPEVRGRRMEYTRRCRHTVYLVTVERISGAEGTIRQVLMRALVVYIDRHLTYFVCLRPPMFLTPLRGDVVPSCA